MLLDDNFASIVKAPKYDITHNTRKLVQSQITTKVVVTALAFIVILSGNHREILLSTIQFLWVNLLMDIFPGIALVTEPPAKMRKRKLEYLLLL